MRRLITDPGLVKVIEHIEYFLGYRIPCHFLPKGSITSCQMDRGSKSHKWEFYTWEGNPVRQASLGHELMHLVLWFEGWPIIAIEDGAEMNSEQAAIFCSLRSTVLHSEVWKLNDMLGLCEDIEHNRLATAIYLRETLAPETRGDSFAASELINVFMGPASDASKTKVREIVRKNNPDAIIKADEICKIFQQVDSSLECKPAISQAMDILGIGSFCGNLEPRYTEIQEPKFREKFILNMIL